MARRFATTSRFDPASAWAAVGAFRIDWGVGATPSPIESAFAAKLYDGRCGREGWMILFEDVRTVGGAVSAIDCDGPAEKSVLFCSSLRRFAF